MIPKNHLLAVSVLLVAYLSSVSSLDDLFYGDGSNPEYPDLSEAAPADQLVPQSENQQLEIFGEKAVEEEQKVHYNPKEWMIYVGHQRGDLPELSSPTKIFLASPPDPKQKVILSQDLIDSSWVKLHYKFYNKKGEPSTSVGAPQLAIYLSTDGKSTLLTKEKETEGWEEKVLKFAPEVNSRVRFVAKVNSRLNEIALGEIWQEDASQDRQIESINKQDIKQAQNEAETTTLSQSSGENNDTDSITTSTVKPNAVNSENATTASKPQNAADISNSTEPQTVKSTVSDTGVMTTVKPPAESTNSSNKETTPSQGVNDEHKPNNEDEDDYYNEYFADDDNTDSENTNTTASSSPDYDEILTESSSLSSFKTFVIIVSICGISIFVYMLWRRRRSRNEDEIPVFSRTSAAEHYNPTFNSDNEIDTSSSANYRSFQ